MLVDFFNHFIENYAVYEHPLAASQLFLAMLGMGSLLAPRDFLREIKQPRSLLVGFGFQWLLVPLIAYGLSAILPIPAGIGVGLIIVASVPGGTLSNILTLYGRGNIALSISLTSITTVAALATTPLLLNLLLTQYLPEDFRMPTGRIAQDIVVTLIAPLLVGMLIRSRVSIGHAEQFAKWMIRFSLVLILIMTVGASGSGRLSIEAYGLTGVVSLVLFAVLVQGSGLLVTRFMGMTKRDGLAIVVEATFRNISLAVAIKAIVFPAQTGTLDPIGDAVLFVALLYGGISFFMTMIPVVIHRRLSVNH
jgi:BASS family bile acid:Na+ symporter